VKPSFTFRFALSGIWKNKQIYIPYLLTGVVNVSLFYMLATLISHSKLKEIYGGEQVATMLGLGAWVVGIFSVIFLFYSNSFLIKRRQKEFGLYSVLGMGKKELSRTLFCEFIMTTFISLAGGFLTGLLLNRLVFLLLVKILKLKAVLEPEFSLSAVTLTAELFGGIFLLSFLVQLFRVSISRPIELVRGSNTGEKEPRTKWILTILGIASIATGYAMAMSQENALQALQSFFIAVLLVIFGTYCLFIAVSIAILKLLRKKKSFYYKPGNFTAVSGMLYRMKQNGVGLASISILSTMVLLTVATTLSLYAGIDDVLKDRFPVDLSVNAYSVTAENEDRFTEAIRKAITDNGNTASDETSYTYYLYPASMDKNKVEIVPDSDLFTMDMVQFTILTDKEYEKNTGESLGLTPGQAALESSAKFGYDTISVGKSSFSITKIDKDKSLLSQEANTITMYNLILTESDLDQVLAEYGLDKNDTDYNYKANLSGTKEQQVACAAALNIEGRIVVAPDLSASAYVESKAGMLDEVASIYGSLFFIGIFLGIVFLLGTVLIIYYKQISEGYDDAARFSVMRKVGMSQGEIRGTIQRQIILVFFLPLLVAVTHILVAYRYMTQILQVMGFVNPTLFMLCTGACLLVFALVYGAVYLLTAKAYYRIVK